jgi:uncharacterized protein (TIGR00730 family)
MKTPPFDEQTLGKIEALLDAAEAPSDPMQRELMGEIIRAALQLGRDGAGTGEIKLMAKSVRELRHALNVFRPFRGRRKISVFGSARTPPNHADYASARDFCAAMARRGWMSITGAGPGIMSAGNEGAGPGNSFGLSIKLPWETNENEFLRGDPKLIVFRYFFTRKLMFAMGADAMAVFPGGYGTMDECFELLTLIQTGKSPLIPIVFLAGADSGYWKSFEIFVREHLLANELIDDLDMNLFRVFGDVEEASEYVARFYRVYHSSRFVDRLLAIRIRHPLSAAQLEELNDGFGDLCVHGRIAQQGPLAREDDWLELPRLTLEFDRKHYSKLRMLLERINDFEAEGKG